MFVEYLLLKFFFGGGEKFVLIFKGNVSVWIFRGSDVVLSFVYRFVCRVMVFFFYRMGCFSFLNIMFRVVVIWMNLLGRMLFKI